MLTTGGTGFTGRDSTPEALIPLFDKAIDGFGELFREVSYQEIGSSTIQSRAVGGLANGTLLFAIPNSTNTYQQHKKTNSKHQTLFLNNLPNHNQNSNNYYNNVIILNKTKPQ